MLIDQFLPRLKRVHLSTSQRNMRSWTALCPAHNDKSPSLSVSETPEGAILLHCHAGCPVSEVVAAIGLELSDLFPDKGHYESDPRRPAIPYKTRLECLRREALIVLCAAERLAGGYPLQDVDRNRLTMAVVRINDAASV